MASFEDIKDYLFSKQDILFDDKYDKAIVINGVFPTDIEKDMIRLNKSVAKFLLPEEEAELRRKEISALSQTNQNPSDSLKPESVFSSLESTTISNSTQVLGDGISNSNVEKEETFISPKNKILLSVNQEMLAKLNNIFSPNACSSHQKTSFSSSTTLNSTPLSNILNSPGRENIKCMTTPLANKPATPISVKSKFLKKYTASSDQKKSEEKKSGEKKSFLKGMISPLGGIGGSLSFLDQIKSRRNQENNEES